MTKSAYDRWLYFISARTLGKPETIFPTDEAQAIMALPTRPVDWRRDKREINKAAKRARAARQHS
jgi:hypothetical protein